MESINAVRASSQRYPDKTTALTGILHSGTPCRNDEGGTGKLKHLEFIYHPLNTAA